MKRFGTMTIKLAVAALSAVVIWSPGSSAQAETETGDRPAIKVPRGGGRAAFERHGCITCHMPDGRGGQNEGGYGADLRVTPLTEEQVAFIITYGRTSMGMPAFKGLIEPETIALLAKYVKEDLRLKK
jgi:mono/diheme cytochrome c family protein